MLPGVAFRLPTLATLAAALLVCGCGEDGVGPHIDRLIPEEGEAGAEVDVVGKRFCGDGSDVAEENGACKSPPAGFVNFGADADVVRASVVEWKHERITVEVPASAPSGSTLVVVTVNGVASNAAPFDVL
jgi:hypothetical protein